MAFNSLAICFEMCTLCSALPAYVRFMSSTCSERERPSPHLNDTLP